MNILFTDNYIKNGTGVDFAAFEESGTGTSGTPGCTLTFTINSVTKQYVPYWVSGTTYVTYIDLADFGVATNALISSIQIRGGGDPDYTAFGAINNVSVVIPEPASLILLSLVGLGFILFRRIHA